MGPSIGSFLKPGHWEAVQEVQVTREKWLRGPNSKGPTVISVLNAGKVVQVIEYCEDCGGTMRGKIELNNDLLVLHLIRKVQAEHRRGMFKIDIYGWIDLYDPYNEKDPASRRVWAKEINKVSADSKEGCNEATGIEEDKTDGGEMTIEM